MAGRPNTIRSNFTFTEGPVWIAEHQALLFTDVRENIVWRYRAPNKFEKYFTNTRGANGMALFNGNQLYMCQVDGRRIMKTTLPPSVDDPPPPIELVTDNFEGNRYNQTNDVAIRSDGNIYFTDPNFRGHNRDLNYLGVFRISPDKNITVIAKNFRPNGIKLSLDEQWLYVTNNNKIERFALDEEGTPSNPKTYAIANSTLDGMAIDDAGNLYAANKRGVEVFNPDGQSFGNMRMPGGGTVLNCTFGGPDRKTLFVTTGEALVSIEMPIPGRP